MIKRSYNYLVLLVLLIGAAVPSRADSAGEMLAAGRVDGFWELGLKPWDTAAGTLLILEAGGRVGTLSGSEYRLGPNIVGAAPKVYEAMIEALAPHVPEALRDA